MIKANTNSEVVEVEIDCEGHQLVDEFCGIYQAMKTEYRDELITALFILNTVHEIPSADDEMKS